MRKTLAALLFALTAALSSSALAMAPKKGAKPVAQPTTTVGDDDPKLTEKDDCRLQRARTGVCNIAIEADDVQATGIGPGGEVVLGWAPVVHPSLVRYRGDFVNEIVTSARR